MKQLPTCPYCADKLTETWRRDPDEFGRETVRTSGRFLLSDGADSHWRYCRLLQRADGYEYAYGEAQ